MFNSTKYTNYYFAIISNASSQNRNKFSTTDPNYIYFENHHIIPKSLGGTDNIHNLVLLTAREHFLCHWLLTKMVTNTFQLQKMLHAFSGMCNWKEKRNLSSKQYSIIKQHITKREHSVESNAKRSLKLKGRPSTRKGKTRSEFYGNEERGREISNKQSLSLKGKTKSKYKKRDGSWNSTKCTDGEIIFSSVNQMARHYKTSAHLIRKKILDKNNTFHYFPL